MRTTILLLVALIFGVMSSPVSILVSSIAVVINAEMLRSNAKMKAMKIMTKINMNL